MFFLRNPFLLFIETGMVQQSAFKQAIKSW